MVSLPFFTRVIKPKFQHVTPNSRGSKWKIGQDLKNPSCALQTQHLMAVWNLRCWQLWLVPENLEGYTPSKGHWGHMPPGDGSRGSSCWPLEQTQTCRESQVQTRDTKKSGPSGCIAINLHQISMRNIQECYTMKFICFVSVAEIKGKRGWFHLQIVVMYAMYAGIRFNLPTKVAVKWWREFALAKTLVWCWILWNMHF